MDGEEYDVADLSEPAQKAYQSHRFTNKKLLELKQMEVVLQRAKNSYLRGLKREILQTKSVSLSMMNNFKRSKHAKNHNRWD